MIKAFKVSGNVVATMQGITGKGMMNFSDMQCLFQLTCLIFLASFCQFNESIR